MRIEDFTHLDLSNEMRLLLAGLRVSPNDGELEKIRKLSQQGIEWHIFISLARRHQVAPLVYASLYHAGTRHIDADALGNLRSANMLNSGRSMARAAELVRVLKYMQNNGVSLIPFKGPVLAQEHYNNLGQRSAGDIDVLVNKNAVDNADRLLHDLGYSRIRPKHTLSWTKNTYFKFRNHHFQYRHKDLKISFELHWRLQLLPLLRHHTFEALERRGSTLEIGGHPVTTLSTEDQLLHLGVHGAAHGWGKLFWIVDIAQIVRKHPDFDWDAFIISAKEQNAERAIGQGVVLAHLLLNSPLPTPVRALVQRDSIMQHLVKKAIQHIQKLPNELTKSAEYGRLFYYRLMSSRSVKYKLFVMLQFLFCPEDWQKLFRSVFRSSNKKRPPDVLQHGQN